MIIGKILIIISFLWPIPFAFVFPFLSWMRELHPDTLGTPSPLMSWYYDTIEPQILGRYLGYWWPLLISLTVGCILCYISKYKCVNASIDSEPKVSPFIFLFRLIKWAMYVIVGFFLLTLVVLGIYYTLFTKHITTIVPIGASVAILGFLIFVGCRYYKRNKNE